MELNSIQIYDRGLALRHRIYPPELVIFYLDEIDPAHPVDSVALCEAGTKRLRPILMSALIAILTLAPLVFGINRGAGLQTPLATAIIFGLIAAVPLVLLFLPAALTLLMKKAAAEPLRIAQPT